MTNSIMLDNVTLKYGNKTVLDNLSISFERGQFTSIMGASGIGKTSVLRLLAGLIPSKNFSGKIHSGNVKIAYCFQEPRLFPWLTVSENVSVVNEKKSSPLHSIENTEKSLEMLELFGLSDVADQYPDCLSGGMTQRVSLARVLASDADLILLDEPFVGLDEQTKLDVMQKLRTRLQGKTVIIVTHSREEAEFFAGANIITI